MKKLILCGVSLFSVASLCAAEAKEEVTAAAKKLGEQANYSWTSTVTVPEGSPFSPGPTEGKAEKGGIILVKSSFGDMAMETVKKGDKTIFTNQDGEWQAPGAGGGGPGGGGRGGMMRNVTLPVDQAVEIANGVKEFKKDGEAYVGDLTEDGAKTMLSMRGGRGGAGGGGPTVTGAKGSAKFWIKDGILAKYELKVSGKIDFNGNEMDQDRTTTVEIKDVGKTKVEIPEAAKKLLDAPAAAPAPAPATN